MTAPAASTTVPFRVAVVLCENAIPIEKKIVMKARVNLQPSTLWATWQVLFNMEYPPLFAVKLKTLETFHVCVEHHGKTQHKVVSFFYRLLSRRIKTRITAGAPKIAGAIEITRRTSVGERKVEASP
jgi:hypothetical protein